MEVAAAPGWSGALLALVLLVLGILAGETAWSRLKFDVHTIPMAPGAKPFLGELHMLNAPGGRTPTHTCSPLPQ